MALFSRNKGKAGERELCAMLRASLGDLSPFERNSMQAHGEERTGDQTDVLCTIPWAFEVKRTELFKPKQWLEQARRQAKVPRVPVVAHRASHEPWRFLFELTGAEFCRVVRAVHMFNALPRAEQARLLRGPMAAGSDNLLPLKPEVSE